MDETTADAIEQYFLENELLIHRNLPTWSGYQILPIDKTSLRDETHCKYRICRLLNYSVDDILALLSDVLKNIEIEADEQLLTRPVCNSEEGFALTREDIASVLSIMPNRNRCPIVIRGRVWIVGVHPWILISHPSGCVALSSHGVDTPIKSFAYKIPYLLTAWRLGLTELLVHPNIPPPCSGYSVTGVDGVSNRAVRINGGVDLEGIGECAGSMVGWRQDKRLIRNMEVMIFFEWVSTIMDYLNVKAVMAYTTAKRVKDETYLIRLKNVLVHIITHGQFKTAVQSPDIERSLKNLVYVLRESITSLTPMHQVLGCAPEIWTLPIIKKGAQSAAIKAVRPFLSKHMYQMIIFLRNERFTGTVEWSSNMSILDGDIQELLCTIQVLEDLAHELNRKHVRHAAQTKNSILQLHSGILSIDISLNVISLFTAVFGMNNLAPLTTLSKPIILLFYFLVVSQVLLVVWIIMRVLVQTRAR